MFLLGCKLLLHDYAEGRTGRHSRLAFPHFSFIKSMLILNKSYYTFKIVL